jgi:CubicO group peptidase (beta-lactamase class C family)
MNRRTGNVGWTIVIIAGAGLLAVFLTLPPARADGREPQIEETDVIFTGLIASDEPGAAVLVVKDGKVVFLRGYGVTDLRTLRRIDGRTNFRLASVTKQFTAMAVMLLVRDGKLSYDQNLVDIFPDFPEYGRSMTVRHLLNHTSGLPDYEDLMPEVDANVPVEQVQIKDEAVLGLLKRQESAKFMPGTRWDYSNSGYVLLGLVVERISGMSFGRFLHHRIFAPLKMSSTVAYERGKNEVPNRAFGYTKGPAGWRQTDQSPTSATLGDGGVYSSLEDLVKWDRALRERTMLSAEEMKPALTPVHVPEGSVREPDETPADYGFGWFLNAYRGHGRMWHYGETAGFRTAIQRFPDDRLTIVVLCNRADIEAQALALKVADLYLERGRSAP